MASAAEQFRLAVPGISGRTSFGSSGRSDEGGGRDRGPAVEHVDDSQERVQRGIGRLSKVALYRSLVQELVEEVDEETRASPNSVRS